MDASSLYDRLAPLYDKVYSWKDYVVTGAKVTSLLRSEGVPQHGTVIEAGCGTGSYLVELSKTFEVAGFDLSEGMLAVAREKLPSVRLFAGDMRDFEVETPVDALVCLFSSIGYLETDDDLERCAVAFARAVKKGGALVVEPWLAPEDFKTGHASMDTFDSPELKAARLCVGAREGDRSVLDMHWLVARPDDRVEHIVERHELRLVAREPMRQIFDRAGFTTRFEPEGLMPRRGLFIGTRR